MNPEAAEEALRRWRKNHDERDSLIRAAHNAGLNVRRIHLITGIARTTIYKVINDDSNVEN